MKTKIGVLVFLSLAGICFSQNQWNLVNSNVTSNLNKIIFLNSNPQTGFIAGDSGVVLKTINGGVVWSKQVLNPSVNLRDIEFLNSQTGWATGASTTGINIYKTTNSGLNWTEVYNAYDAVRYPTGIHFTDSLSGFITGGNRNFNDLSSGFVIRTTNGGMNWVQESWNLFSLNGISFRNADNGWLVTWYNRQGMSYGEIYQTTTGGINWDGDGYMNYDGAEFTSLCHKAYNQCWTFTKFYINQQQYIDFYYWNGTTWIGKWYDIVNYKYTSVNFYDSLNGYMCTDLGHIRKTTNGGTTLINQNTEISIRLNSITMPALNKGFAVGNSGKILTNINLTGLQNAGSETPIAYSLSQNYPNPFNPITNVKFSMLNVGDVKIVVYDIQGREVQTLVNEKLNAGTYEVKFDGSGLTSGVYFYRLTTDSFIETKKMLLIK